MRGTVSSTRQPILEVHDFAQLRSVDVAFGDLTILVGPQATGKSTVLQLLKLAVDSSRCEASEQLTVS